MILSIVLRFILFCQLEIPDFAYSIKCSLIHRIKEKLALSSIFDSNMIIEMLRPRGKIVFIGDNLDSELKMFHEYLCTKKEARIPSLLLTQTPNPSEVCDQVVIFDSKMQLSQIHSLLNSYFLIFIFNSSEKGIFNILGSILASIKYTASIPLLIDTGEELPPSQKSLIGECYFNFNLSVNKNRGDFLVFINSIISSLNSIEGLGVSFSDLIQLFGQSKRIFYIISSSIDLDESLESAIDQIGYKLVSAMPEEIEDLEAIFISVTSSNPLNLQKMNDISKKMTNTFGPEFEIYFSNLVDSNIQSFDIVLVLTDVNAIDKIIPGSSYFNNLDHLVPTVPQKNRLFEEKKTSQVFSKGTDEDERFNVLGQIFSDSEVYIFNDGGLPLFASHRPAGQEVCLFTGLFSAIQSMSSDLIGHTPDHLTAGDKRCVFMSQVGPEDTQLRGVAICKEGSEENARNDLYITMNLVKKLLKKGEPEYAINDKIQRNLVHGFKNGSINSILKDAIEFHAS